VARLDWKKVRPGDFPTVRYGSTTIEPHVTLGEASRLLGEFGAYRFEQLFEEMIPVGVRFSFPVKGTPFPVTMRAPIDSVLEQLHGAEHLRVAAVRNRRTPLPEAELRRAAARIAWRRLYYLLEQVLLLAQDRDFPAYQLLMGFYEMEDPRTGEPRPLAEVVTEYGRLGASGAARLELPSRTGGGEG
jgi:hypothetical protein